MKKMNVFELSDYLRIKPSHARKLMGLCGKREVTVRDVKKLVNGKGKVRVCR